ncbi:MAG: sigma-70 family RNA polymerase sigma factor [Verrucomicrobiae bacterium]|nr:sigma-70 family RNA polymerase sigma factor [Verrucomicrobiae bacterium]
MNEEREDELVRAVQAGRLEDFEELIHQHASRLRAFVAMRLPVAHLIDEIAHETFVFAYHHIDDFEAGTDFGKWLRAIAFNLVRQETLRHSRMTKHQKRYLEHCLIQSADKTEFKPDDPVIVYLEECIDALPDGQRTLLRMKYRLSQTSKEMSRALDQSDAWVRTTLCRVRSALRECVEAKAQAASTAAQS